ncbi:hypothetical protein [Shewanella woodyi]|uniref:Lipoprotein n=1 Tax=Shewanella woodyi (strain ATCC 51908 / MS32) TaxID=392500 RepID=B1KLX7_SHEWM|nr:hypothetical protein [Shewanella woodyi]ACA88857.1 hypothetical protein Swoo_4607 [Shewanella woodyi ATCC 51908]
MNGIDKGQKNSKSHGLIMLALLLVLSLSACSQMLMRQTCASLAITKSDCLAPLPISNKPETVESLANKNTKENKDTESEL